MTNLPNPKNQSILRVAAVLFIVILLVVILFFGRPFLVPIVVAILLSFLLLPVCKKLEAKGAPPGIAIFASMLLMLVFISLIFIFVKWQITDLMQQASSFEDQLSKSVKEFEKYISQELGISVKEQEKAFKDQTPSDRIAGFVGYAMKSLFGLVTNTVLVVVYVFLFLLSRHHLKQFILRIIPSGKKKNTEEILHSIQGVTQKYLTGLTLMIVCLWILYSIGFAIVGVKSPVFFAVLCGLFELVPFVGNLTGTILTIVAALVQGGDSVMIMGILITYGFIQFFQSYVLEPLVVGAEVNINPLFTILGLVAGEMIWSIPGMILAIPLMGIMKIVFDHIEPLKPYGDLIGSIKSRKKSD